MNEITDKWVKVGLVDGIDNDDHRDILAQTYEDMANYMVGLPDEVIAEEPLNKLTCIIFPLLRRTYGNTDYLYVVDTIKCVEFCLETIKANREIKELLFLDVNAWVHVDYEAEATLMISDLLTIELQNGRLL